MEYAMKMEKEEKGILLKSFGVSAHGSTLSKGKTP